MTARAMLACVMFACATAARAIFACAMFACAMLAPACSQNTAVEPDALIKVGHRAATAGDRLVALAPRGADVVIELDVARLRSNEVVGPMVTRLIELPPARLPAGADLTVLQRADHIVLCAYDVGSPTAGALTLLSGPRVVDVELAAARGRRIDDRTVALGPPELLEQVAAVAAGSEPDLTTDRRLMAARTFAMPPRAEGASVRLAARLGFDARVSLAGRLGLDEVPRDISLWGDVADDLAIVATFDSDDPEAATRLARDLERLLARASEQPWVRARYLHFTLRSIEVTRHGGRLRAVLVIGPRRLQLMTNRLSGALAP